MSERKPWKTGDSHEDLPEQLRCDLEGLYRPPFEVPEARERRFLSVAAWRIASWRRQTAARVAAVAALMLGLLGLWWAFSDGARERRRGYGEQAQAVGDVVGDVDGDGQLDIVDAYLLSLHLEERQRLLSAEDLDADGALDRNDVDWIIRRAVAVR